MKASLLVLPGAALMLAACVSTAQNPSAGHYQPLFNGKDLSGWVGLDFDPYKLDAMTPEARQAHYAKQTENAKKHWSVKTPGELYNDGHGAFLSTEKEYGDIDFTVEYKTVPKADSGVYLRTTPQVQIWDYTEKEKFKLGADKGSGGLWNNSPGKAGKDPLVKADKPFGEWNKFRIVQTGARTSVWLNGQQVVDHVIMENFWKRDLPLRPKGHIQLQTHGGEITWRNIGVRELTGDEANAILAAKNSEGFVSIFNGKDFEGWQGALDQYEIRDGAIYCKQGKGGHIYTKEKFADFTVRLEFQLPPAGNNGLALRYPGKGNPAYEGFTELQVLDSEHPKYAKLDKRQYCGSVYGVMAAHRGYLRPTGEWNFYDVTLKGSKIRVELNGTVILEGDPSTVKEFMDNSKHPGLALTEGFFGFAGHNDPVGFRNIRIKKL